jgi:uncharacterized protein
MESESLKIAVVGSGVAGLTATHILQRKHDVTLFEKQGRLGGHTNTISVENGDGSATPVDTGFIVMNDRNYPLLTKLFRQLKVDLRDSDMSFSYYDVPGGLQYSTKGFNRLFAQRKNLLNPRFIRMILDILRFYKTGNKDLRGGISEEISLGDYLKQNGFGQYFIDHHLIPMGSAIWSTPCDEMMQFPAVSFLNFFHNHGLLDLKERPQWKTVIGGSCTYIERMRERWKRVEIVLNAKITGILRRNDRVLLNFAAGDARDFDQVVIATHADQALLLLEDPDQQEREYLGAWSYSKNRTLLHTDPMLMPPLQNVWSSWNFERTEGETTTLTYDMNRLQGLDNKESFLVTLNPRKEPSKVIEEQLYEHPMFTHEAVSRRNSLQSINGKRQTWYAGSYFGNGFHEDAVRSAVQVAKGFGLEL